MKRLFARAWDSLHLLIRSKVRWAFVILSIALAFSLVLNGLLLGHRAFTEEPNVATRDSERSDTLSLDERKAAAFALYAMKLREEELSKIEPQTFVPTSQKPATRGYPWKTNIVMNVFWIGQRVGIFRSRSESAWDPDWLKNYGGVDDPDTSKRQVYAPAAYTPRQNPFYCALPYNDVTHGQFKPEAPLVIPWFKQAYTAPGQSVCKSRWIAIRKGNRTCYAQWEDCGPFLTDHLQQSLPRS